jgi:hypothetical protein
LARIWGESEKFEHEKHEIAAFTKMAKTKIQKLKGNFIDDSEQFWFLMATNTIPFPCQYSLQL